MKISYFFLLFITQLGFSQAPAIEWQKALGGTDDEYANITQQTTDGGYIVAGRSSSNNGDVAGNHGGKDYWGVKLNGTGSIQLQKALGGTSDEIATSIQETSDGGYILAGQASSNNGDVTGYHGGNDCWVVKLNSTGTIEWQKALGGSIYETAVSIQQTTDGGYIVVGQSSSNDGDVTGNHGGYDSWVVKLNSTGTIQWQKALGGTGVDSASSIQQTVDGGFIVAGYTYSNDGDVTGNHGGGDYWVVKLNSTGTIQWQKALGGIGVDAATSMQQTTDGGYIVAGVTTSNDGNVTGNHGGDDYWVVKLNITGNIVWQKTLGGTGDDKAQSIQQTSDGDYIVAGYAASNDGDVTGNHGGGDYWLVKLNNTGTIVWQKTLGGSSTEYALSIQQTNEGYILGGITTSNDGDVIGNHGGYDAWVVKLGSDALSTITFAAKSIKLFPNPTAAVLTVQGATNLVFDTMIITDLTGKTVLTQTQNSNQINVEQLASGMYILQAISGEEKLVSRFVKE